MAQILKTYHAKLHFPQDHDVERLLQHLRASQSPRDSDDLEEDFFHCEKGLGGISYAQPLANYQVTPTLSEYRLKCHLL